MPHVKSDISAHRGLGTSRHDRRAQDCDIRIDSQYPKSSHVISRGPSKDLGVATALGLATSASEVGLTVATRFTGWKDSAAKVVFDAKGVARTRTFDLRRICSAGNRRSAPKSSIQTRIAELRRCGDLQRC